MEKINQQVVEKSRSQRVTTTQKEIYISYLENNAAMRLKKSSDIAVQHLWEDLAVKLNGIKGPKKNKEEWKRVFDNWRNITMKKKRVVIADRDRTGGGPASEEKLTDLEERALTCWGNVLGEGIATLPAIGFGNVPSPSEQVEELFSFSPVQIEPELVLEVLQQPQQEQRQEEQQQQEQRQEEQQQEQQQHQQQRRRRTKNRQERYVNIEDDKLMDEIRKEADIKQKLVDSVCRMEAKMDKLLKEMSNTAAAQASMAAAQTSMAAAQNSIATALTNIAESISKIKK